MAMGKHVPSSIGTNVPNYGQRITTLGEDFGIAFGCEFVRVAGVQGGPTFAEISETNLLTYSA